MPLEIRQKQSGDVLSVDIETWDKNVFNHDTWDIITQKGVVQMYHLQYWDQQWVLHHRMERQIAIDWIKKWPNRYRYEDIPDFINPSVMAVAAISNIAKQELLKIPNQVNLTRDLPVLSSNEVAPKQITSTQVANHIARIKKISLIDWAAIWTIIAGVVAVWIYVISPLISFIFN